jgi:hypothetical protein
VHQASSGDALLQAHSLVAAVVEIVVVVVAIAAVAVAVVAAAAAVVVVVAAVAAEPALHVVAGQRATAFVFGEVAFGKPEVELVVDSLLLPSVEEPMDSFHRRD